MQAQDLTCSECQSEFKSASSLLQHFASHAADSLTTMNKPTTKKKLPDLYPIGTSSKTRSETDVESDSGVEDVNPLKFCLVTMDDETKVKPVVKKYQCSYCSKRFGWSTDLKRHVLTHTGERPFPCQLCDCAFTRNFLLLNHQKKCHGYDAKSDQVPGLNPIGKPRRQEKSCIKRKMGEGKEEYKKPRLGVVCGD